VSGFQKRFRTPREFIFHAIWLMGDMKGNCDCPYCTKRAQKEVTADLEAKGIIIPSSSGTQRLKPIRSNRTDGGSRYRARVHDTRTYAAVRPVPKLLKPKPGTLKQAMLVERDNDLRAIYSKTSMELRRWFREGEVVWCVLSTPISAPESAISVRYWPAVIEQVKLKSVPVPQPVARNPGVDGAPQPEQAKVSRPSSSSNELDPSEEDSIGPRLETSNEPVPWSIHQFTRYEVQLLAVSRSYTINDEYVLPYAAHIPSEELINFMLAFDQNKLVFEKETLLQFNPCSEDTVSIYDAIPAYAMALQIASTLSSYWCLTDEYDVKYSVSATPPTSPKPPRVPLPSRLPSTSQLPSSSQSLPPPQVPVTGTLESAINQAGETNAQSHTVTTQSYHKDIHTVDPSMSQSESQRTSQRILGLQPPPSHVVQKRFQGFWWGTERIWVDDFIRLKLPRRTLAPTGTDHILAPSGPGKALLDKLLDSPHADNVSEFGAGSRGVFLRLDGIFAVDVLTEDRQTKKEARVCGMLYELAEEDWEDPKATANRPEPTSGPQDGAPIAGPSQGTSSSSITVSVAGVEGFILPSGIDNKNKDPYYLLPQAPIGFKFRPILVSGYEFIGAMGLISGRYYPRILSHPVLKPTVEEALIQPKEEGGIINSDNLWALEGLSGGYFNSMDPVRYKKSRVAMMQDADLDALARLRDYAEQKRMENKAITAADEAMDVDIDDIYA